MLDQDAPAMSSGLHGYVRRAREHRRGAAALMAAVRAGVTPDAEPRVTASGWKKNCGRRCRRGP